MLITSVVLRETPFILLRQAFGAGSMLEDVYWGLFDLLKFTNVNVSTILMLDICVGIIYVIGANAIIARTDNVFLFFSGVSIAQAFWFYKQPHDNIILAVPCIALIILAVQTKKKIKRYLSSALVFIIVFSFYIQGFVQRMLPIMGVFVTDEFGISLGRTCRTIVLMICGIGIGFLHKNEGTNYEAKQIT